MAYSIEKHIEGFVLVRESGSTVTNGAPHNKSAKTFKTKAEAVKFRDLIDIDTFTEREDWTAEHYSLFDTIPEIVRNIAGDLFEVKWYSHENYDGMLGEVEHNLLGKSKLETFKTAYDSLTDEQKNLIYYAYEA